MALSASFIYFSFISFSFFCFSAFSLTNCSVVLLVRSILGGLLWLTLCFCVFFSFFFWTKLSGGAKSANVCFLAVKINKNKHFLPLFLLQQTKPKKSVDIQEK